MSFSVAAARRAAKFGAVGISGVCVNMFVLWLLKERAALPLWLAGGAAIELSILNNFFWNYHWTFGERRISAAPHWTKALLKYHFAVSVAAIVNFIVLWALHHRFGKNYLLANALGILMGLGSNYLFSNFWVFKSGAPE